MTKMKLSILIPIKNEYPYICELLDQLLPLNRNDTEIIISDNYSDDGSWEYIQNFRNDLVITRPDKACFPFENHLNALRYAKGEYIFIMGGDDLITKSVIEMVIPHLKENKIVIGQVKCFDDKTGKTIQLTNTNDEILKFFRGNMFSLNQYLQFINYDQLIFSFAPRIEQNFIFKIRPTTFETFATWVNIFNFYDKMISDIVIIPEPVLNKRYHKVKNTKNSFSTDQLYSETSYTVKAINSILNSFLVFSIKGNVIGMLKCLFMNRWRQGNYDNNNTNRIIKKFWPFNYALFCTIYGYIQNNEELTLEK